MATVHARMCWLPWARPKLGEGSPLESAEPGSRHRRTRTLRVGICSVWYSGFFSVVLSYPKGKGVWMVPRKPFIYLIKTIHFISWTAFLGHTRVSLPVVCVCWGTLGAVGDTGAAVAFLCNILIIPPDLFKKSEKQKNKIGSK